MSKSTEELRKFLEPVLKRVASSKPRSQSVITSIAEANNLPSEPPAEGLHPVISRALTILGDLLENPPPGPSEGQSSPEDWRAVYALLDLLSLEVIYPSLSPGVGIPIERRVKPIIQQQLSPKTSSSRSQLRAVTDILLRIWARRGSLSDALARRSIADLVAANGELAFNTDKCSDTGREPWIESWRKLVDSIPTEKMIPIFMSMLHPKAPKWFATEVKIELSMIPTKRNHGVRAILNLFISSNAAQTGEGGVSVEALGQAARLIGSVPQSLGSMAYFTSVGKQLLELLEGRDQGLRQAAAFVIADFLDKKGPIEEVVQREICNPLLKPFSPDPVATVPPRGPAPAKGRLIAVIDEEEEPQDDIKPVVSENDLHQALENIAIISTSHPTPSIPNKLLTPIMLPLWGLYIFSLATKKGGDWSSTSRGLIVGWMKSLSAEMASNTSRGYEPFRNLLHNISFSGRDGWEFGSGPEGGIEIRRAEEIGRLDTATIDTRVEEFMAILEEVNKEFIGPMFLDVLREWLAEQGLGVNSTFVGGHGGSRDSTNPTRTFTSMKLLQVLLVSHTDALARNPTEILQMISGILTNYVAIHKAAEAERVEKEAQSKNPSISTLHKIFVEKVDTPSSPYEFPRVPTPSTAADQTSQLLAENVDDIDIEDTPDNILIITLSLLNVIICSPETQLTPSDHTLIQTIMPSLTYLTSTQTIDRQIASYALNISSILATTDPNGTAPAPEDSQAEKDRKNYKLALTYLTDPLVPVRAHGLSLLRDLITAKSPIINPKETLRLLTSMISDQDSFVYLNVIKTLVSLSSTWDSHFVVKELVAAYLDVPERLKLDERLRIGEALIGVIQKLGTAFTGDSAKLVSVAMAVVISRRKVRLSNKKKPNNDKGKGKKKVHEDEGEFEIELPDMDEEGNILTEKQVEELNYKASIVENWTPEGKEDYRLRTSALSILSVSIETNALGIPADLLLDNFDTSLSILQLEKAPEASILRRAALVTIGEIVKSGRCKGRWGEARRVVGYIGGMDNDGLVREMAHDVVGIVEDALGIVPEEIYIGGTPATNLTGLGGIERLNLGTGGLRSWGGKIEEVRDVAE
ncbi:hypothetical protein BJ508DRAFT_419463 [Ascobolus immersus RN42]|uniref:Uncharacterized protein n=1 Tax=Ascobolus immersus RN42 TaxID=1160509 RepID=A0A3N4HKI8_ASCIM|nr:hypothetical protein BJ508DRAFT_419463 [Ascobolus immersus RN42]